MNTDVRNKVKGQEAISLREEGRLAYLGNKPITTCPYRAVTMHRYHWMHGYLEAQFQAELDTKEPE